MLSHAPDARSLRGRLSLRFADDGRRTVLAHAERSPPWHVQRLLYLDPAWPALAGVALLNQTAGLFAGDRLDLAVTVEGGAAVSLSTPTVTRAYAMPEGDASVTTCLTVSSGGYLEYLPEPTLLCRDAALVQTLALDAEPGAAVALGEVLAFGRAAHGERHAYRSLTQRIELRRGGETVLAEALRLTREDAPDVPGMLGPFAAYGSLHLLPREGDPAALLARTRAALEVQTGASAGASRLPGGRHQREGTGQHGHPGVLAGASLLPGGAGVAVRVLGEAAHAVQTVLRAVVLDFRACLAGSAMRGA
jgi:urease accessory protein